MNADSPGLIDAETHDGEEDRRRRLAKRPPGAPMKRAGAAEESADAIVWLLSGQPRYVTGANLRVSGGR